MHNITLRYPRTNEARLPRKICAAAHPTLVPTNEAVARGHSAPYFVRTATVGMPVLIFAGLIPQYGQRPLKMKLPRRRLVQDHQPIRHILMRAQASPKVDDPRG